MSGLWSSLKNVSRSARIGVAAFAGGGILGAAFALGRYWYVILGAVVLIGLLLVGYALVLRLIRKRKRDPFEQELRTAGGTVPGGAQNVGDQARLDDLRKRFDEGIAAFRQRGKDLYSLPWFVIIGEPGSGKTEAIRHCGIGFPPGLQDELQGTGGTINMDWWFTNNAVILDTAGRLTFGEVDSTDSREWAAFLELLRRNRPNCPINGLLVTIPVDSLMQDDAEQIEQKGGRISRQLDLIQRTLGVRFPVVIIITKADKLTGFRPYFSEMRDPQLQHQMLGWSNPAPLDEPLDLALVGEHLAEVKRRLTRRRFNLLLSESTFGQESGDRTDQVDELCAFPEQLMRIAPRLRRYLELIFAGGAWAGPPLFLRGIFFTSSMQHGEALDLELAEALNVPVDSLHEVAWKDDRAYFLRDVFKDKIFREKGLVTNAPNARARQRRRRSIVWGAGIAANVLAIALIVYTARTYKRWLGQQVETWNAGRALVVDTEVPGQSELVQGRVSPGGADESDATSYELNTDRAYIVEILADSREMAEQEIPGFINLHEDDRREACGALFELNVVVPLVRAAQDRLEAGGWDHSNAVDAVAQLIGIRVRADAPDELDEIEPESGDTPDSSAPAMSAGAPAAPAAGANGSRGSAIQIEPLLNFVLHSNAADASEDLEDDIGRLQEIGDWLYSKRGGGRAWPSALVVGEVDRVRLSGILDRLRDGYVSGARGFSEAGDLFDAVVAFRDREAELLALQAGEFDKWTGRFGSLDEAKRGLDTAMAAGPATVRAGWASAEEEAKVKYERLLLAAAMQPSVVSGDGLECNGAGHGVSEDLDSASEQASLVRRLHVDWNRICSDLDTRRGGADLDELDRSFLDADGDLKQYQARFSIYRDVNGDFEIVDEASPFGAITTRINDLQASRKAVAQGVTGGDGSASSKRDEAGQLAERAFEALEHRAAKVFFATWRDKDLADAVADQEGVEPSSWPTIPFADPLEKEYRPDVAAKLFGDWDLVSENVEGEASGEALQKSVGAYRSDYVEYWSKGVIEGLQVHPSGPWSEFARRVDEMDFREESNSLSKLGELIAGALKAAGEEASAKRVRNADLSQDERTQCQILLREWSKLARADSSVQASNLLFDSPQLKVFFICGPAKWEVSLDQYVLMYWKGLASAAIQILADDATGAIKNGWKAIEVNYAGRFPLGPLCSTERVLSKRELNEAKERCAASGIPATKPASLPELDGCESEQRWLEKLRRPLGTEMAIATGMREALNDLDGVGQKAKISVRAREELPTNFFVDLNGGGDGARVYEGDRFLASVPSLSERLHLTFKEKRGASFVEGAVRSRCGRARVGVEYGPGFALYELIADSESAELKDDAWIIDLEVEYNRRTYQLQLRIEFQGGELTKELVERWRSG